MSEPIFVIHGVGNRDRDEFTATVQKLATSLGGEWDLHPVFWGDLGADDRWINRTIPGVTPDKLRDGQPDEHPLAASLLATRGIQQPDELRDGAQSQQLDEVKAGVREKLEAGDEIRDAAGADEHICAEIEKHWADTQWLPQIHDPQVLREIGAAIAGATRDNDSPVPADELRDGLASDFIRRRLHELDRVVGAVVGSVAGQVNTYARSAAGPGIARFLGDILVYQRHQELIHARVRETIAAVDPTLGTPAHPARIIAHSLGGVIAVDLATADDPLWVSHLVSFGSQFAVVHAIDPRGGQLAPVTGAARVPLPESLGAWTNLWEPMDVLAFLAAGVFTGPHDSAGPRDVEAAHLASSGLWTHSAYWTLPELANAVRNAFGQ